MTHTAKTSCKRTEGFEAYTVRAGMEWATILIRGWQAQSIDGQPQEIGEILVHSSFGNWAHQWAHLGEPFKKWLLDAERDYMAVKFMGAKAYVFDGEKTVAELKRCLLHTRSMDGISKNDARTVWDWIDENQIEMQTDERSFVDVMQRCVTNAQWLDKAPAHLLWDTQPNDKTLPFLAEPWERLRTSLDHGFANFWRLLMPVFREHLRDEIMRAGAPKVTT